MRNDIDRILITQQQIAQRVGQIARQITDEIAVADVHELTIVPILTGAVIFCADLIRQIPITMRIGLLAVSSYPDDAVRTRGSQVLSQQLGDIRGRDILLVDDILDSGGTLRLVVPLLKELDARSVRTCVLLRKDREEARRVHVDYLGFDIPDVFVVGYGLDYNNYYRNLPDICTLRREVLERP